MRLLVCLLCAGTIGAAGAPAFGQSTGLDGGPDLEARAAAYHAFILGRSLEGAGDVDGAVDAYRRASELDPEAADIWAELAGLYARRNQAEEALTAGAAALRRDAANAEAHRILGLVYAARAGARGGGSREDAELALDHLQSARNPEAPDAGLYLTLGRLLLSTGEVDEAIVVLDEVLAVEPQFAEAIVMLAQAYESKGEWEAAAAAYERAVLYCPRRAP